MMKNLKKMVLVAITGSFLIAAAGCGQKEKKQDAEKVMGTEAVMETETTETGITGTEIATETETVLPDESTEAEVLVTETEEAENAVIEAEKPQRQQASVEKQKNEMATKDNVSEENTEELEKQVTIPNLIGLSQDDAMKKLGECNLTLSDVSYEYSAKYETGSVISQSLEAGKQVDAGAELSIKISKGNDSGVMPDVIGLSATAAKQLLEANGFVVETSLADSQIVKYQSYHAGDTVQTGTSVKLQ